MSLDAMDAPSQSRTVVRDMKTLMCRINRLGWVELRRLSTDLDRPLDDLMIECLNELLSAHGRPAVVEKRPPIPLEKGEEAA